MHCSGKAVDFWSCEIYTNIILIDLQYFFLIKVTLAEQNAAATDSTISGLDTLLKSGEDAFNALHQAVLNIAGVKNDAELYNKVETQVKSFGSDLSNQVSQLREEVKQTLVLQSFFIF